MSEELKREKPYHKLPYWECEHCGRWTVLSEEEDCVLCRKKTTGDTNQFCYTLGNEAKEKRLQFLYARWGLEKDE